MNRDIGKKIKKFSTIIFSIGYIGCIINGIVLMTLGRIFIIAGLIFMILVIMYIYLLHMVVVAVAETHEMVQNNISSQNSIKYMIKKLDSNVNTNNNNIKENDKNNLTNPIPITKKEYWICSKCGTENIGGGDCVICFTPRNTKN